jgi:hypothetical protein
VLNLADNNIKAKNTHQHALSHAVGLIGHYCDECGKWCTKAYRCRECGYDCCAACNTNGCPVIALADAIKNNGAVSSLSLADNEIKGAVPFLIDAILKSTCLVKVNLEGNSSIRPPELNGSFQTMKAFQEALEKAGGTESSLACRRRLELGLSSRFLNENPVIMISQWTLVLWVVVSGYIDMGMDLKVAYGWYNARDYSLFGMSLACIGLSLVIQLVMVDTTWCRRLLTTTHLKLLFDGVLLICSRYCIGDFEYRRALPGFWSSYRTAIFVDAVCKATVQSTLQSYKAFQDHADGKGVSGELLFSVAMSFNAIALGLMLFLEPNLSSAEGLPYLGLYMYHIVEISFRVLSFSLLGFASMQSYGHITFAGLFVVISLRAGIRKFYCNHMPLGMLVASIFVDSAWPTVGSYRIGSTLTVCENVLFLLWPAVLLLPATTALSVGVVFGLLLVARVLLWWGIMGESCSWSRYYIGVVYEDETLAPEDAAEACTVDIDSGENPIPRGFLQDFLENRV